MPNNKGGKNFKKASHDIEETAQFIEAEPGQDYARIIAIIGNGQIKVYCNDGRERVLRICGRLRKRRFILNDIVLYSGRDYEKGVGGKGVGADKYERGDLIHKYYASEHNKLRKLGTLNPVLFSTETSNIAMGETDIFDDVDDGEEEEKNEDVDVDDL
jgi:initiation factor 1A